MKTRLSSCGTAALFVWDMCSFLREIALYFGNHGPLDNLNSLRKYTINLSYPILSLFLITAMEELDGDTVRLSSRGRTAERDIVQVRTAYIC